MFSTAIVTPSSSNPVSTPQFSFTTNTQLIIRAASKSKFDCVFKKFHTRSLSSNSFPKFLFRVPNGYFLRHSIYTSSSKRVFRPVMESQTCTVKMEVDVPVSVAYDCYSDREAMPKWMPFISSVQVLEDKPDQSRWTLKYKAFGRDIEFSWLARNLQPIRNQKIHWRSVEGLQNSGAVRFYPKGPSSCLIELSVSYEVPQLLAPVASALQPFLESLLLRGLERFSKFAKSRQPKSAN
ncbi:unnamed protein product [Amaranthus hypochondriacus]